MTNNYSTLDAQNEELKGIGPTPEKKFKLKKSIVIRLLILAFGIFQIITGVQKIVSGMKPEKQDNETNITMEQVIDDPVMYHYLFGNNN